MAVPFVGTMLAAFGVEAAKVGAPLMDAALSALLGARAKDVLEEVGARFRAYTGHVPPNHDLERTLRLVQLTATLLLLREYRAWDETARFDDRAAVPPPFIAAANGWLLDQIGLCPRMTVRDNPALTLAMEGALDEMLRSGDPADAARSQVAAVEASVWAELVAGAGTVPPDEFRARFHGEKEGIAGWRDLFLALVREALKEKPRVQVAFFASRLAALRDDSARMRQVLDALDGRVAELQGLIAQMTRVEGDVTSIRGDISRQNGRWLYAMAAGVVGLVVLGGLVVMWPASRSDLDASVAPVVAVATAAGETVNRIEVVQTREAQQAAERHATLMAVLMREKGVPLPTLAQILRRMGEEGVADTEIEARLQAKAEEYIALRAELEQHRNARPDAARARACAQASGGRRFPECPPRIGGRPQPLARIAGTNSA